MTKADVQELHESSRILCDIEDCIKTSWRIGDLTSVRMFVAAFVKELRR